MRVKCRECDSVISYSRLIKYKPMDFGKVIRKIPHEDPTKPDAEIKIGVSYQCPKCKTMDEFIYLCEAHNCKRQASYCRKDENRKGPEYRHFCHSHRPDDTRLLFKNDMNFTAPPPELKVMTKIAR